MDMMNPSVMVSRLDLVVLDSAAAEIDFSFHGKRCFAMGLILWCSIPVIEGEMTCMYRCY